MGKKEAVPNRQYTTEFRQEAVRLAGSIGGNAAAKRLQVPQSTVTSWVRRARTGTLQDVPAEASPIKRPVSELDLEIAKKGGGVFREGVAVKYAWIEANRDLYSVSGMSSLLGVSRTGYCQWQSHVQPEYAGCRCRSGGCRGR